MSSGKTGEAHLKLPAQRARQQNHVGRVPVSVDRLARGEEVGAELDCLLQELADRPHPPNLGVGSINALVTRLQQVVAVVLRVPRNLLRHDYYKAGLHKATVFFRKKPD